VPNLVRTRVEGFVVVLQFQIDRSRQIAVRIPDDTKIKVFMA
jgi:hypothetical protein